MIASTMCLTVDMLDLDRGSGWAGLESLAVAMREELPAAALAAALHDAQAALLEVCCGPAWRPVRHLPAPFGCPRCAAEEDFARYGVRPRLRRLHTAVGLVELRLANVRCRGCDKVFAPLLIVLGLWGKRRADRLTVDLADLAAQMSFARAGRLSRQLAGTGASGGQAHGALADVAAVLAPQGSLGPATGTPEVVLLDGTGVRAGDKKNGVAVNVAIGLTGRSGPPGRRRARSALLGLTVDEDWSMMGAQLASVQTPDLVVVDGEESLSSYLCKNVLGKHSASLRDCCD